MTPLKLYYAPGACSLSPHIALREAELPFSLELVDFRNGKRLPDGRSFADVSPKGYVPALELEGGVLLTEGAVLVQWIADRVPQKKLAPPNGSLERVRLQEALHYIATELHKGMSPLYSKLAGEDYKVTVREKVGLRFDHLAGVLAKQPFLLGDTFTVADGYLFYTLRSWQKTHQQKPSSVLAEWYAKLAKRPSIAAALDAEHLEP